MCGIAGMAGVADELLLQRMLHLIRYRGPDDSGIWLNIPSNGAAPVALGNNRLSIQDLSPAGHQPIFNEDGSIGVVYNGEIYNFQELRRELVADGHVFRSHTDTEILPHLYEKYGAAMVERLNGIFAFAMWDDHRQKLLIFRDRMGVKPLYYAVAGRRLYFASELKALLLCPNLDLTLDPQAIQEFLALLYVPNPRTFFAGIHKLPPGAMLEWQDGRSSVAPWWEMKFGPYFERPERELSAELRDHLESATRRQLISDVPVGFFLSGGIDSSAIVACAAKAHARLRCYSISFREEHGRLEQSSDDARFAREVATQFGAEFTEVEADPAAAQWLPKAIWHLDDPVADPAAIATYLICRTAKPDVTVLLSGQGGDEVLGGYRVHLALKLTRLLRRLPASMRQRALPAFLRFLARHNEMAPRIAPGLVLAFSRYLSKLASIAGCSDQEQYIALRSYLSEDDLGNLLSPAMKGWLAGISPTARFQQLFSERSHDDVLNQLLYVDGKTFLPDLNLAYSDKLSMACSIEVRVPFLDNEVVDFLLQVPPSLKIHHFTQKYLLKRGMDGILPPGVIHRRKAGFGLPVRAWLQGELRTMTRDLLSPERLRQRGQVNGAAVARMLEENETGRVDHTYRIWALLTMEIWQQTFLEFSYEGNRLSSLDPVRSAAVTRTQ